MPHEEPGRKRNRHQEWPYVRYAEKEKLWLVDGRTKDGGSRRFFPTVSEAEVYAQQCRVARGNSGTSIFGNAELARYGKTVQHAIDFYLDHLRRQERSVAVNVAITAYREHIAKNKRLSERYTDDLRLRQDRFAAAFGEQQIGAISADAIVQWLEGLPGEAGNRNTFRRRIAPLFAFAKQKKWRADNPFAGGKKAEVAQVDEVRKKVRILSLEQVSKLLEASTQESRAFWAIALFAGLRPESEILRLQWEHIHLKERVLIVDGEESETEETKTGRRVVKISENLAAFLLPLEKESGPVAPTGDVWRELRAVKRRAGFGKPGSETDDERAAGMKLKPWVPDYTRHTFISYHLAHHGDIGITATQAGNSPEMVKKHYLSLVRPAAAAKFWTLAPA